MVMCGKASRRMATNTSSGDGVGVRGTVVHRLVSVRGWMDGPWWGGGQWMVWWRMVVGRPVGNRLGYLGLACGTSRCLSWMARSSSVGWW